MGHKRTSGVHPTRCRLSSMSTTTQGFTVQQDAKRLIVKMRPDSVTTMAYDSNPSVAKVLTVNPTDGTSVLALAPDADINTVRAQLEGDPGTRDCCVCACTMCNTLDLLPIQLLTLSRLTRWYPSAHNPRQQAATPCSQNNGVLQPYAHLLRGPLPGAALGCGCVSSTLAWTTPTLIWLATYAAQVACATHSNALLYTRLNCIVALLVHSPLGCLDIDLHKDGH